MVALPASEATKEARKVGISHGKSCSDACLGRKPTYDRAQFEAVVAMLNQGESIQDIAKASRLSHHTVYRIRDNTAEPEAALARLAAWSLRSQRTHD